MKPRLLLARLDEIARSLAHSGHALALIGLGSVGLDLSRLDSFSDLDFFVLVEPGYKHAYLENLGWLSVICPIDYWFANTVDGCKLLFADGIFCEFAVFEPQELQAVPFAPGRIVWKQPQVPASVGLPSYAPVLSPKRDLEWLLGETLTNILVGLQREQRGERLSAMRFIQGHALDRLLELAEYIEIEQPAQKDNFSNDRRFEQRFPGVASQISACLQGYERNRESALAILAFLQAHFTINEKMAAFIRQLCASC